LSIIVFFSLTFSLLDIFLFLKIFCSTKYVLLTFFSFLYIYIVIVVFIGNNTWIFKIFSSFKCVIFYCSLSYFMLL
jgi:hypothetical protein